MDVLVDDSSMGISVRRVRCVYDKPTSSLAFKGVGARVIHVVLSSLFMLLSSLTAASCSQWRAYVLS